LGRDQQNTDDFVDLICGGPFKKHIGARPQTRANPRRFEELRLFIRIMTRDGLSFSPALFCPYLSRSTP
jgi:hypothetical protein